MSGIRFFKMSFADPNRAGVSVSIDSNDAIKDYLTNRENLFCWASTGSDDANPVTLEVTFDTAREIDTLILVKNNLKTFSFDYLNGVGSWVNLITESTNSEETYFSQFSAVTTTSVRLVMTATMVADAQKTMRDFIITKQIGRLVGYPRVSMPTKPTSQKKTLVTGKHKILQSGVDTVLRVNFKDHVGTADRTLFNTLVESTEEFLIWPCGGDMTPFAHGDKGWRLEDIFLVQLDPAGYTHEFTKNLYFSGMNASLTLIEVA